MIRKAKDNMSIRSDANFIIQRAIASAMPDEAVRKAREVTRQV